MGMASAGLVDGENARLQSMRNFMQKIVAMVTPIMYESDCSPKRPGKLSGFPGQFVRKRHFKH